MPFGTDAYWGVVLPVAKTNLVINPSAEYNFSGWSDPLGVGLVRTAAHQAYGAYGGTAPSSGFNTVSYGAGTFVAGVGTAYTVSLHIKSTGGSIIFGVANDPNIESNTYVGSVTIGVDGGTWQRHSLSYTEAAGGDRWIVVARISAPTGSAISMDGAQAEVGSLTTYIDGDQEGCYWLGAPHASQSARSGTYRGGGSVVALRDLGLVVQESPGIGMPALETTSQSFALTDGAQFQRQRAKQRAFSLNSNIPATSFQNLHVQRQTIIDALKIDLVSPQQPTRFWYVGGPGTVTIDAVMDAGLEFNKSMPRDGFTESPGVRFIAHDPLWYTTIDQGTTLASRASLGSTNFIAWRDPLGRWGTTGSNGTSINLSSGGETVNDLLFNNGTLFVVGNFGTAGGTAARQVAMYRQAGNTWGTLAGGTTASINNYALALAPSGSLFVGGDFTTAGGTRSVQIAQWNGAWGTLIGGTIAPGDAVRDLLYSPTGTLFAAGGFVQVVGTRAVNVAMWTGAAWGTLGPGTIAGGLVISYALAYNRGRLFLGGDFTTAGGTQAVGVAQWGGGGWGTLGQGMLSPAASGGTIVYALGVGANQILYAGGIFGSAGGGSAQNTAQWNGVQWSALAQGIGTFAGGVYSIQALPNGNVFIGGNNLTPAPNSGYILPDDMAVWNGYAFTALDIDLNPGGGGPVRGVTDQNGTLWVGGGFSGTAKAAAIAQIYNTGRTETYPVLVSRNTSSGTARIYQLANTLTGDTIWFNLALLAGETMTLDLRDRTLMSDFRGNIFDAIVPASNLASWRLMPGTNYISLFADNDSLVNLFYWRPRSWSADSGTNL